MRGPPFLWVVAGPNGAGKSTYYATRIRPRLEVEFVNADEIAAARWGKKAAVHAYDAADLAERRRALLLRRGRSFVAETVLSHPSKLDLLASARELGYEVWLTFIGLADEELSVERVAYRVRAGGHAVPERKIRARFRRSLRLARSAIRRVNRAFVVDNSEVARPLRDVLAFERGRLTWRAPELPAWCRGLVPQTTAD